jgi:hypothetical protein
MRNAEVGMQSGFEVKALRIAMKPLIAPGLTFRIPHSALRISY